MQPYYFRISNGNFSGDSGHGFHLADNDAAWLEMTKVCADLVGGIARKLEQNCEWHMELLNESREPLFRIRLVAEVLDQAAVESGPPPEIAGLADEGL